MTKGHQSYKDQLMKKFVILTTQRSGSTVLWRCLDSNPVVSVRGEMFLPRHPGVNTYMAFRKSSTRNQIRHYLANRRNINAYFGRFFSVWPDAEAVGFKLMYGQMNSNIRKWIVDNNVSIIHLVRKNTLKIILSRETKNLRQVAHITSGERIKDVKVKLDVDTLVPRISRMADQVQKHREMFSMLPYLEVTYEDFVSDPGGCAERIFAFLGVSGVDNLELPLKKINPDSVERLIENYAEVRARLLDSPYADLLDS
jgi:LPS sulfotransferase NodH